MLICMNFQKFKALRLGKIDNYYQVYDALSLIQIQLKQACFLLSIPEVTPKKDDDQA